MINSAPDGTGEYLWIRDDDKRNKFLSNFTCQEKNDIFD